MRSTNDVSACSTPVRMIWPYGPSIGLAYSGILSRMARMISSARLGRCGRKIAASLGRQRAGGVSSRLAVVLVMAWWSVPRRPFRAASVRAVCGARLTWRKSDVSPGSEVV